MASLARREDLRLLTGAAEFVGDVRRPDQLWLAVVRSAVAHGRLEGVDAEAARAVPGVVAVLSAADAGDVPTIPLRTVPAEPMQERLQPVIASGRVRYVGEPVAVVVATDPYIAEDAAELVVPRVEPLPPVVDAWMEPPATLWDLAGGNELCRFHAVDGDVEAAFAAAAHVVEAELSVQRHTGVPMETRGLVAEWEGDRLHLWGPTKYVHFTRTTVAGFFGLPPEDVIVHRVDVGGMFGVRGEVYPEDFLVPWAARMVGKPVKWIEDRREHFVSINHSRDHRQRVSVAVAADGELLAMRSHGVLDLGAYPRPIGGRMVQIATESMPGPYRWRAVEVDMRGVATNKTPVGTMRGPSSYETTFVRERVLDLVAARLGMDPLELRRRNLVPPEAMPFVRALGPDMHDQIYDSGDYPALLDEIFRRSDVVALREEIARRRADGELVGLGSALFLDHSGLGMEESVGLRLDTDGRFVLGTSASEIGQGLSSMASMVIAEALGVDADDVTVEHGDSRAHGGGRGTFASRTTIFVGNATTAAAGTLREQAVVRAAELLGVPPDEIEVSGEGFRAGSETLAWKDVAPLEAAGSFKMDEPTYGIGMHLAVVSVDRGTADVRVERLVVGYDAGRILDHGSAVEQLRGAAIMGLGGALFEELAYDENGQPVSTTFIDYLLPTSAETPRVEVHALEQAPSPGNPLGVKGVGEAGIMGVGGSVANAVADALGTGTAPVLFSLPLKPDVVMPLLPADDVLDRARDGSTALPAQPAVAGGDDAAATAPSKPAVSARMLLALGAAAVLAAVVRRWMKDRNR